MNYPSNTIKAITEFLFIETENIEPSDLVIVLGNDMIDGTMMEVNRLYISGKITMNAKIILTGATGSLNAGKENECDSLYRSGTQKYGMSPSLFVLENEATNAYQNFIYSKQIIESLGGFEKFNHILCIGKAFLLRRASMYAAKLNYPTDKIQYYGTVDRDGRNIGKDSWWKSEAATTRVLAEIKRIGEYGMAGDLSIW
jgi:uncharacterized SAM-binding protein YcdF (DUF218 family)